MIKKLRIKLIAVSMLAIFIVLGTIVTVINIINYTKAVSDADAIITELEQNDGKFPEPDFFPGMNGVMENMMPSVPSEQTTSESSSETAGMHGFRRGRRDILGSPETRYESRFFSVQMYEDGTAMSLISMEVAAIDESKALSLAEDIFNKGSKTGFYENYRFRRTTTGSGPMLIFLDCTRSLSNVRNTLLTSILVSLLGLGAVFVLVLIFSRRIVRPVSESYEKQKEFITNAGHEIKTPLSIILADAEVLEMDNGENEWIDDIKLQTQRLTSLTNDLVFLAKMEETVSENVTSDFSFSDLVNDTVKSFSAPARTGCKTFALDLEEGIEFNGDRSSMEKFISILLDNAIKYTPEGGYIHSALSRQKNKIIFSVANTVKNDLDPDDLEHFFDRFYRSEKSRNSKTGGYGIGLSVAKAVVERHRGKIRAYAKDKDLLCIEASFPG